MRYEGGTRVKKNQIDAIVMTDGKQQQLYKRTLWIVILSQIFSGAGLAAGITVGALMAKDMLGGDGAAGIPSALFTFGSGLAAYLVGRYTQSHGRRLGLSYGFFIGAIGAVGVIAAAYWESVPLLLLSLFIYGSGTATNLQARYAGTDLALPQKRATAVSAAMVSTTFGAVAGPNLVAPMGRFADSIGFPTLSGPFMLAAVAYTLAGLVLYIWLRPDPFIVAQQLEKERQKDEKEVEVPPMSAHEKRGVTIGTVIMVISHVVMVAIMTMTPIYMQNHGFTMEQTGMVIGFHIAGMYLPSLFTGVLVDKIGRTWMAVAAGTTLLIASLLAAFGPVDSLGPILTALILLGVGWNFGLISGTAIVVDSAHRSRTAKVQGSADVFIALSGAGGSILSGVIVSQMSYLVLGVIAGVIGILIVPFILWGQARQRATLFAK